MYNKAIKLVGIVILIMFTVSKSHFWLTNWRSHSYFKIIFYFSRLEVTFCFFLWSPSSKGKKCIGARFIISKKFNKKTTVIMPQSWLLRCNIAFKCTGYWFKKCAALHLSNTCQTLDSNLLISACMAGGRCGRGAGGWGAVVVGAGVDGGRSGSKP